MERNENITSTYFINPHSEFYNIFEKEQTELLNNIIEEYIPKIANGTAPRMKQDESQTTYVSQRKPEDGLIDWSWNAGRIKDFIRAQSTPYPGAFTLIKDKKVTIWDADIENTQL